jgi:hypothetical protein
LKIIIPVALMKIIVAERYGIFVLRTTRFRVYYIYYLQYIYWLSHSKLF